MIDQEKITRHVTLGIKDGLITTEEEAREVAARYISDDEESYEITTAISSLLPRKVDTVFSTLKRKHPWFKGKMTTIIYQDIWGRYWSKSKGVVKPNIPVRHSEVFGHCIDKLGGMSWSSEGGKTFICEYRIEKPESEFGPDSFVG